MFYHMSMTLALILIVVVALFCVIFGVLWGSRASGALQAERDSFKERFANAVKDLANTVVERDSARLALAGHESAQTARDAAHAAQLAELRANRDALAAQFSSLGAQLLEQAQTQFLERADARFKQSEAVSGEALKALLAPVNKQLERYEQAVEKVETDRRDAFVELKGQIESMRTDAGRVASGANNIINALRNAPKTRGNWGEQQLRNVLETCGLSEHTDFDMEVTVGASGGRLRADAVIRVPGGQTLIIDAKVSFNDYQDAINSLDEPKRLLSLERHARSMKAHVDSLNIKDYSRAFGGDLNYVIMFVGGEHFLSAALEHDNNLWDYAWKNRVLIATPTNLVAIARTVSAVWRQEKLARQAQEIGILGKQMHDRLALVSERFARAGGSLNRAVESFNDATKTFNGDLAVSGRKFKELGLDVGVRELDDIPPIEKLVTHAVEGASDGSQFKSLGPLPAAD